MWALGILFYKLLVGFLPFPVDSNETLDEEKQVSKHFQEGYYFFPKSVSVSLPGLEVITSMLQDDPEERIDMVTLSNFSYIKGEPLPRDTVETTSTIEERMKELYDPG